MARARGVQMSRPARIGLIAVVFAVFLGVGIYLAATRRGGGYRMGVHFASASGLAPGARVFLSGVTIGAVYRIRILPDASVDVILAIAKDTGIPKGSKFSVQTSLTGSPTVSIVPARGGGEVLPKRILPVSQQPAGSGPLSIEELMHESRGLAVRSQSALTFARSHGGRIQRTLQDARNDTAALSEQMRLATPVLMASARVTLTRTRALAGQASSPLHERNRQKIELLADSFGDTMQSLKKTTADLQAAARDPRARSNVRASAAQLQLAAANLQRLTRQLGAASSAQTRAQMRDAALQLQAIREKLRSLL